MPGYTCSAFAKDALGAVPMGLVDGVAFRKLKAGKVDASSVNNRKGAPIMIPAQPIDPHPALLQGARQRRFCPKRIARRAPAILRAMLRHFRRIDPNKPNPLPPAAQRVAVDRVAGEGSCCEDREKDRFSFL